MLKAFQGKCHRCGHDHGEDDDIAPSLPATGVTVSDATSLIVELLEADRAYHGLTVYSSADAWRKSGERRTRAVDAVIAKLAPMPVPSEMPPMDAVETGTILASIDKAYDAIGVDRSDPDAADPAYIGESVKKAIEKLMFDGAETATIAELQCERQGAAELRAQNRLFEAECGRLKELLGIALPFVCVTDIDARDEDELRRAYPDSSASIDRLRDRISAALAGQVGEGKE